MKIKSVRKGLLWAAFFVLYVHLAFVALTLPVICAYRYVNPPTTGIRVYRAIFYRWPAEKSVFLPIKKIPARARNMILKVEDGSFYTHHGVLPAAMKNAWKVNKGLGKPVYGGSTITMQTARTLLLVPEKSYLRKYLEVIIALEMEAVLGKDRIFELYLNNAEWGKGVYGIEAAARHHYGVGIRELSTDQTARLVTLLSSPIKYTPATLRKNGILRARYNYLLQRFSGGSSGQSAPSTVNAAGADANPASAAAATGAAPTAPEETASTVEPVGSIEPGALDGSVPSSATEAAPTASTEAASPAATAP